MQKQKVLLADDDIALGKILALTLQDSGYDVHYQTSATGLNTIVREWQPDIIVLDVELGERNGITLAPQLKAFAPDTPVLFISSHVETRNVVEALGTGAVAYLKKPFEIGEFLAYIQRYLPAYRPQGIALGTFRLDAQTRQLMRDGTTSHPLSPLEFRLLRLLALHPNQTVRRQEIEAELWESASGNGQSLNNYIVRLRRCLASDSSVRIVTIPKVGYRLEIDAKPSEKPAEP